MVENLTTDEKFQTELAVKQIVTNILLTMAAITVTLGITFLTLTLILENFPELSNLFGKYGLILLILGIVLIPVTFLLAVPLQSLMGRWKRKQEEKKPNSITISEQEQGRILNDRVEFKLWACERYLSNLKELERKYGNLDASNARLSAEFEIDGFLAEIVGALDSLLFRINEKLSLGILDNEVRLDTVQRELNNIGKSDLLQEVHSAMNGGNWLWALKRKRNYSMHNRMLPKQIVVVTSRVEQFRFYIDPYDPNSGKENKEIIQYFVECINDTKQLIQSIIQKEPVLQ